MLMIQLVKITTRHVISTVKANVKLIIAIEVPKSGYRISASEAMKDEGKKQISIIDVPE